MKEMEMLTRTLYAIPMAAVALWLGVWGSTLGFSVLTGAVVLTASYEVCTLYRRRLDILKSNEYLDMIICYTLVALYGLVFSTSAFYIRDYNLIPFLFSVVWIADTSALCVGKMSTFLSSVLVADNADNDKIKRKNTRLLRFISEHKTISGCIGGLCGGTLTGMLVLYNTETMFANNNDINCFFLSAVTAMAAVCGDLIESAFKRMCQTKDSDVFIRIPGHGGILDRVDSILVSTPVCCMYLDFLLRNSGDGFRSVGGGGTKSTN